MGLISDNRKEWLVADLALLSLGACDVPRGCDSMGSEIRFILSFAECEFCFFENSRQLHGSRADDEVKTLKNSNSFEDPSADIRAQAEKVGIQVLAFESLMEAGRKQGFENAIVLKQSWIQSIQMISLLLFLLLVQRTPKVLCLHIETISRSVRLSNNVMNVEPGDFGFLFYLFGIVLSA